jgi:hypothetical protein
VNEALADALVHGCEFVQEQIDRCVHVAN